MSGRAVSLTLLFYALTRADFGRPSIPTHSHLHAPGLARLPAYLTDGGLWDFFAALGSPGLRVGVWETVSLGGVPVVGEVLAGTGALAWPVVGGTRTTGSVAETGVGLGRCKLGALGNVGLRTGAGSGAATAIGALGAVAGRCVGGRICGRSTTTGAGRAGGYTRGAGAAATGTYTGAAAGAGAAA